MKKMTLKHAICVIIGLLVGCTVTYIKSDKSKVDVRNNPHQGVAPVKAKIELEHNPTTTPNEGK